MNRDQKCIDSSYMTMVIIGAESLLKVSTTSMDQGIILFVKTNRDGGGRGKSSVYEKCEPF